MESVVSTQILNSLVKLFDALEVPFEAVLHKVGIDAGLLNMPDTNISTEKYLRLYDEILLHTGNEDFGLMIGRIDYLECFHLYMSLAASSKTLRDWINLIPDMNPASNGLIKSVIRRKGDQFILEMGFDKPSKLKRCLITDSFMTSSVMLMDAFSVFSVRPVRVDFTYPRPRDTKALEEIFRAPLYFNRPASGLCYHKSVLNFPQLHVSTSLYDNVKKELEEFLSLHSWDGDPFSASLYTVVRRQLHTGNCSLPNVAETLNISSRTLQLRLETRGTQFRHFLQQVRSELAVKYLRDKNLNIIDIALSLGYRDATSFSAAFKVWHGISPSEYRRT